MSVEEGRIHYFGMLSSGIDPDIKVMKSLGIQS